MSNERKSSTHRRFGAPESATSKRVDQFCDQLRDKLNGIEDRVNDFKAKIASDREATKAAIDKEVDVASTALQKIKDDAEAARARMKAQVHEQKADTEDLIAEWKRRRDVEKLERRAEDAEAYAAWSVIVAAGAIDEADLATMQAIAARLDVERAAGK